VINLINELEKRDISCEVLKYDHTRESYTLEKTCQQQKLEYSGARTPRRNGKVEVKFQTLYGRIWAKLNYSGIEGEFRDGI
jgi:hypothetical protein